MSHSPLKLGLFLTGGVIASSLIAFGAVVLFKDSILYQVPSVNAPTMSSALLLGKDTQAEIIEQVRARAFPASIAIQSKTPASAIVLTSDGYALTTLPIPADAKFIVQGKPAAVTQIYKDEALDIAIVKLEVSKLPVMRFRESAFMSPGTDAHIVSANTIERTTIAGMRLPSGTIQSVSVWPSRILAPSVLSVPGSALVIGDSMVGMVVDAQNHLVLPTDAFAPMIARFLKTKTISHPELSIEVTEITPVDAQSATGIVVKTVKRNSAAEKAGILPLDVITALEGQNVRNPNQFAEALLSFDPEAMVRLTVLRGGKTLEIPVVLKN